MTERVDESATEHVRHGPARSDALRALVEAARALEHDGTGGAGLAGVAAAAAKAAAADLAVIRVADDAGFLVAREVWAASPALVAELRGSRAAAEEVGARERDERDERAPLPPAVAAAAARARTPHVLLLPIVGAGGLLASLELMRREVPFSEDDRLVARVAAEQVRIAVIAAAADGGASLARTIELAGEALAATAEPSRALEEVLRVAAVSTAASAALLWRSDAEGRLVLEALHAPESAPGVLDDARETAERVLSASRGTAVEQSVGGLPGVIVSVPIGQPAASVLQLLLESMPSHAVLDALASFGARVTHSLRAAERSTALAGELERTRTLLGVVAQANAELSLAHTLEITIGRVAELLDADRVGVYLRDELGRLTSAGGRGLAGPHTTVAERLLDLALGPYRARGTLLIEDAAHDPRLAGLAEDVEASGIEAAVAAPLVVAEDVVGLLAVYPPRGRSLTPDEWALLSALAAQVAVSVQNARLHEQATELGSELRAVLAAERRAARRLAALYEISRAFTQSLSLEATLEAVARTVVELLDEVDVAVMRMPDARREMLVPRAVHVADPTLAEPLRSVFGRPQPIAQIPRRVLRTGRAIVLDAAAARRMGEEVLLPFLERGVTAAILPIATPGEVLGTLTLLSLDAERPIAAETLEIATSVATQAALAIDNARLYQQQKDFSETMQRSLLPHSEPQLRGIEVGHVYESSARVDVGGDVYDFLELDDGCLAVILGDVTGHGIDAAADMAMAKFVFRSLAREHPSPSEFLAAANEVVCGEIAPAKFITMLYVTIDASSGVVRCAGAGHPPPRLVRSDGSVAPVPVRGLALGIETGQVYEETETPLERGAALVLFTDGLIEARRDGDPYGEERLDRLLSGRSSLPARELAAAVVTDCRAFSGGDLDDDCAVVVVRRLADDA